MLEQKINGSEKSAKNVLKFIILAKIEITSNFKKFFKLP